MDTREIRREELQWLQRTGISGIKVDFFGGDKQSGMRLYEELLTDANDFGISVNLHGSTLPRGWERKETKYSRWIIEFNKASRRAS